MSFDGRLRLEIVDVYGRPVTERAGIFLSNRTLDHRVSVHDQDVSLPLMIGPLHTIPVGLYQIEIDAPSYLAVGQFISIPEGEPLALTVTLPVNARRVVGLRAPAYEQLPAELQALLAASSAVMNFVGLAGRELYGKLDDLRKAGLLNLFAKSSITRFQNQRPVFSYIRELIELRGDRFFAKVDRELRSETANSVAGGLVHPVSGALHTPPSGYDSDKSYKTLDRYGNLQLSFFKDANGDYAVDMDIDDAQGLEHVFQVMRNAFEGPTNPYNIHEILLASQRLDTRYELMVREAAAAQA